MIVADPYFNGGDVHSFLDALSRVPAGDMGMALVGAAAGYIAAIAIDWLPASVGVFLGMCAGVFLLSVIAS